MKLAVIDEAVFDAYCGVNVVVSEAQIKAATAEIMTGHREGLLKDRYAYNFGLVLKSLKDREDMRWADRKLMKDAVDAAILDLIGLKRLKTKKPWLPARRSRLLLKKKKVSTDQTADSRTFTGDVLKFHKPGENQQLNDEIMRRHLGKLAGKLSLVFPEAERFLAHWTR